MLVPSSLHSALDQAVAGGIFPGAVLAIRQGGARVFVIPAGRLSTDPPGSPVTSSTIYDLASLTKPLATVTAMVLLVQRGQCRLDNRVDSVLLELQGAAVGSATFRQLLTHSSGLPGWRGFYEQLSPNAALPSSLEARAEAGRQVLHMIAKEPLVYGRGERSLYSDLGFMLLGLTIERLSGISLDRFVCEHIVQPLNAHTLSFLPIDSEGESYKNSRIHLIAPTERDTWRGRLLCGEVHDENAAALGGVAGHAGLFGTAEAVLAVTGAWLTAYHRKPSILNPDVVQEFLKRQPSVPGSSWVVGWDTPSSPSSSGRYFSSHSFGHLGYTGTSVWIDPACELEVVLLSNRVHPTRKNEGIRVCRPMIHDLVYQEYAQMY
ncbi:MAG: serine hydrolase [Nitrospira sp.]|nr:serine hydrolase [Nitrospira sp.]MDH5624538.1 serine hydrolase [Nitrospira sp.]